MTRLPHAIPYQGSKRTLAPMIAKYVPLGVDTFYEPFAGSAAMTIYAAHHKLARRFIIGDSLAPMVELLRSIVEEPRDTALKYCDVWNGQTTAGPDYFNMVRERFNQHRDPVDLLYLVCRCVKNAIRFNSAGRFTQSVDKRRLGMRPEKMADAIGGVSVLLRGRTEFRAGDWLQTLQDAEAKDFAYLDPPYLGTSIGRDRRYHAQITTEPLVAGLRELGERGVRLALSYDGMTGEKEYGPPLPEELGLVRLLLHAGKSSQATLSGKSEETIESLYISPSLGTAVEGIIRRDPVSQQQRLAV